MLKLAFFVPVDYAEPVKEAVFLAGAGKQGLYEKCAWETLGWGQYQPLAGSKPFIGAIDTLERVEELRVEMLCPDDKRAAVEAALKATHPYQEPAFEFVQLC